MNHSNFHTHTVFSDGKEEVSAYVEEAVNQNLSAIGFSDHAPLALDCSWAMDANQAESYLAEVKRLRAEFKDQIEVYCGLEVDYIPNLISINAAHIKSLDLDYTIGAIHFVDAFPDGTPWAIDSGSSVWKVGIKQIFGGSVEAAVKRYFELTREMLEVAPPTIVAHLDRIKKNNIGEAFYSEEQPWYKKQIELTLAAISESGSILEVNTKGLYRSKFSEPYPSRWVLRKAAELDIPVHLAADAHHPYLITGAFDEATKILTSVGYERMMVLKDGVWSYEPLPIFT